MTHASPPALHVLLAVRLRAPVGADELALITGLDEPALSTALVTA